MRFQFSCVFLCPIQHSYRNAGLINIQTTIGKKCTDQGFLIATEAVNTLLSTTNTCKSINMSTKTKVRREYNITHLFKRCHFKGLNISPLAKSKSNYEMKQVCTVILLGVWAENT